jgi:hypothetical protein
MTLGERAHAGTRAAIFAFIFVTRITWQFDRAVVQNLPGDNPQHLAWVSV